MIYVKKNNNCYNLSFKTFLAGEAFHKANNAIKSVPGRTFIANGKESYWTIPLDQINYLKKIYPDIIDEDEQVSDCSFDHIEISTDLEYIDEFNMQPYAFQILAMNFLSSRTGALLADSMGLGKSFEIIGGIYKRIRSGEAKNALIICPASLKYQWGEEIEKFLDIEKFGITYLIIDGTVKKREKLYQKALKENTTFVVTNYETVRNDIDFYSSVSWDILAIDEAHRLGNQVTQAYKAIAQIEANTRWMATGTPLQNKPSELFHLFSLIDPDVLGRWISFRNKHIIIGEQFGKKNVPMGTKNLSAMHNTISPYMLRRLKQDVAPQLPEMIINDKYISMTAEQEALHGQVYSDLVDLIKEIGDSVERNEDGVIIKQDPKADRILGLMIIMQEIADDPMLLNLSDSKMVKIYSDKKGSTGMSAKTKELLEILKEYIDGDNECKAVVFSRFTRMQGLLYPLVSKIGKTVVVHGGMNAEDKNAAITQFRNDPEIRFLLASDALNYGVNLNEAQLLINYDLDFNPAVIDQRNNRIHRINSTGDHVTIINLISRGAIDEVILNAMMEKKELSNQVVENTDSENNHLGNLVKIIQNNLDKGVA